MSKTKILIVEDERITAEDLKNTLENMGYEVTGLASSADSFYTCLSTGKPDLVLMDIYLKGPKDGIELATEIKEKYQLPVIYLTAYSDSNILERAKITEPFGFILKPFQDRELHSNIEMALHKDRMEKHITHLNAILKAIRDVNQLIVRVKNKKELLQKTCETLISTKAYASAWFLIIDQDGNFRDAASAGLLSNFDGFIEEFQNGFRPECIGHLNNSNEVIYSITDSNNCNCCSSLNVYPESGAIISKVNYQSRLFGYLNVTLPITQVNDPEELKLLIEISDDLGLALNNLEQLEKNSEVLDALRISEEKFRALYQNSPLSYQSLDENGYFIDINPMWEKTLGYLREEVIGKWYGDFLHPDYVEHFRKNFPAFKKRGSISGVQFKLRKKSGEFIHVSFEGCVGYYPDGSFRQTYCVFKDITEQKNAEEALNESEIRFRHAFDFAATSMLIVTIEGEFQKTNVAFRKLTGYTEEELAQMHFNDITHTEDKNIGLDYLAKLTKGEIETATFEKRYISKAKNVIWVRVYVSLVRDELSRPKFLVTHLVDLTERKIAEKKLADSDEQYRTFINSSTDLVCLKDEHLQYVMTNKNLAEFLKAPESDIIGKTDLDLMPEELAGVCHSSDKQVLDSLSSNIFTELFGNRIYESHKFPVRLNDGNTGVGAFIRDVTEQVHSKQELQKLSQVVQQSPESIILTDTNGNIEYANPAACRLSGYTIEELTGKNPRVLKSGETPTEEYKELWDTITSGNEWKGDFHNRKKNGELYWERATISAIKNTEGEITHFLGLKEDITGRKHNEGLQKVLFNISKHTHETGELKQLFTQIKDELNQLFDTTNFYVAFYDEGTDMLHAVYVSDEKDAITEWPAGKSLTGYVIKNNKSVLFKHDDFQKLMETGELELIGVDSEIWLGVPLTVDGKTYGAIVIQDYHNPDAYTKDDLKMLEFIASQVSHSIQRQKSILDLQEAFVKAEASDKLKTAFINNISHEIRTPLNGILGFTEMSLNPDTTPEDHELFFTVIKKSSKRLLNTITSYMDISMLVSGTMEIIRRPSNLDKLIKEINADFSEISVSKGIDLKVVKPDLADPLILNTDIEKLRKILTHLLDNAFKFTQKGTICFGYEIKDTEFEFSVSDTGTGIKTNLLNVIFDAFMQADVSSTRGYEGSGLGLTIANGLVKLLGGNLRIDTERGKGSVFYFTLPFSDNPILTPQKTVDIPKPVETETKPLILIAEDDDSNYKYIEIVLMYSSYRVLRAENGIEAVDCLRKNHDVSLVLMDIKMPLMDGFEATRQIRTFMPAIPIIALTAHVTAEDESLAISSGCNEYVTKPVSKAKLLEIIEDSLALNRSTQTQ